MYRKGAIRKSERSDDQRFLRYNKHNNDDDDDDLSVVTTASTDSASDDGEGGLSCDQKIHLQQSPKVQHQMPHLISEEQQKRQRQQQQQQTQDKQRQQQTREKQKNEKIRNSSPGYATKVRTKSSIVIDINIDNINENDEDKIYNNSNNDKKRNRNPKTMENNIPMETLKEPTIPCWSSSSLFMWLTFLITLFCSILVGGVAFQQYVKNNQQQIIIDKYINIQHEYITIKNETESNKLHQLQLNKELELMRNRNRKLEKEQIAMKEGLQSSELFNSKLENDLDLMRQKVFDSIHQRKKNEQTLQNVVSIHSEIKRNVQDFSRALLRKKYGGGPYYAEIVVEFHPESNVVRERGISNLGSIIIEIAPIDEMPHTVYWFLEQITEKSYDDQNVAFHINDDHIIQAGTNHHHKIDNGGLPKAARYTNNNNATTTTTTGMLSRRDLAKIIFQEYSPNYTHKPYTLGLPGKLVGRRIDFYISVRDNTIRHGPGGRNHRKTAVVTGDSKIFSKNDNILSDDADPCFAKVIHGFHVVDNIHLSATFQQSSQNNSTVPSSRHDRVLSSSHFMKHTVAIRRISLLNT